MRDTFRDAYSTSAKSRGLIGWWLRLTAPPGAQNYNVATTHHEREHLRRAGLTSTIAPFVFVAPLLLAQQATIQTLSMTLFLMVMVVVALVLNRTNHQHLAAILLILSMDLSVEGALLFAGLSPEGLGVGWLLSFDLFCIPLIAAGVLLSRTFIWYFALLHIACIVGNVYLLPHAPDLEALILLWNGPTIAFARPILLQIGGGLLCYVAVRSTDEAIIRANRAEHLAALERAVAEQHKQLEVAAQTIYETLTQVARGKYSARAQVPQGNVLWNVAQALNTLVSRLEDKQRTEHEVQRLTYELSRAKEEAIRLAQAVDDALLKRQVIRPAPANTLIDPLIERFYRLLATLQRTQQKAPGPTSSEGHTVQPPVSSPHSIHKHSSFPFNE